MSMHIGEALAGEGMPSGWRARTATDHGRAAAPPLSPSSDAWASRVSRDAGAPEARVYFRIEGVCVILTSRPSGPKSRVTTWPQGSFRVATSSL